MTDAPVPETLASTTDPPSPAPDLRIVEGSLTVDDLDTFLASVDAVAAETGTVVQAFDADRVVDATHLRKATRLAARAIARDEAVARDPAVEILLYAAGRRQIDAALDLGVSPGRGPAAVVVADFGDVPGADRPDGDLNAAVSDVEALVTPEPTLETVDADAVRDYYAITDAELAAVDGDLAALVHERVALLDVEK